MGNLLAECRRCGIDQCELCTEVQIPRHAAGDSSVVRETGSASNQHGQVGSQREYQPQDMSEHDMLQHALRLSRREAMADRARRGGPPTRDPGSPQASPSSSTPRSPDAATRAAEAAARIQERREQELVEQAIHRSRMEEENRQRMCLLDEQEDEYQESLRIDQQKEVERALRQKEQEEQSRREAEEEELRLKEQGEKLAETAAVEQLRKEKAEEAMMEARRRLLPEPPVGELGRVVVQVRVPDGRRLRRAFRGGDPVGQIYDYASAEGGEVLALQEFHLASAMPRCVYDDHEATLESVGLKGQCSLLVEVVSD